MAYVGDYLPRVGLGCVTKIILESRIWIPGRTTTIEDFEQDLRGECDTGLVCIFYALEMQELFPVMVENI